MNCTVTKAHLGQFGKLCGGWGLAKCRLWKAAHYVITMNAPITNNQAALLRKTLAAFAPARCVLAALDYQAVPLRYNAQASFDGSFNFGAA